MYWEHYFKIDLRLLKFLNCVQTEILPAKANSTSQPLSLKPLLDEDCKLSNLPIF